MNNSVICNIDHPFTTTQYIPDDLLIFFGCWGHPNMRQVYLLRLQWVTNVVMCLLSSAKSIWWNPYFRSTLFNTVLPFKSWRTSSTVGMGWHSLVTPWLVRLMSTQMLTSPQQQVGRPNWLVPLVLLLWSHKPATHLTFSPLSPHTKWNSMDRLCNWFYRGINISSASRDPPH